MSPRRGQNPVSLLNPISDVDAARAVRPQTLAELAEAIVAFPVPPKRACPHRLLTGAAAQVSFSSSQRSIRRTGDPRRRRARRWLFPAPLLVTAAAALVVVLTAGESGTSLLSRAYAAITPTRVIVHYVQSTTISSRVGERPARGLVRSVSQVWTSGSRTHVVTTLPDGSKRGDHRHATIEIAIDGNRMMAYAAGRLLRARSPSCVNLKVNSLGLPLPLAGCEVDPVASLRHAYRSGKLHADGQAMFGGHPADVIAGRLRLPGAVVQKIRVVIDPSTFIALEIQTISGGRLRGGPLNGKPWQQTTTSTFTHYQRLTLTSLSVKLLALPAPRARPKTVKPVRNSVLALGARHSSRGQLRRQHRSHERRDRAERDPDPRATASR